MKSAGCSGLFPSHAVLLLIISGLSGLGISSGTLKTIVSGNNHSNDIADNLYAAIYPGVAFPAQTYFVHCHIVVSHYMAEMAMAEAANSTTACFPQGLLGDLQVWPEILMSRNSGLSCFVAPL